MIQAIGIDLVGIDRCAHWHTYSPAKLARIFSSEEIRYCLSVPAKSAERFAVRFAAKEAFYKSLSSPYGVQVQPFLTIARHASVSLAPTGSPQLLVDWPQLNLEPLSVLISLSHTKTTACACIFIAQ